MVMTAEVSIITHSEGGSYYLWSINRIDSACYYTISNVKFVCRCWNNRQSTPVTVLRLIYGMAKVLGMQPPGVRYKF